MRAYNAARAALNIYAVENNLEPSEEGLYLVALIMMAEALENNPLYDWVKVGVK